MSTAAAPLHDWLAHRAANSPARAALVFGGRTWSYAELDRDVTLTARRLASLGIGAGDRVAMLLHNSADAVLVIHAVLRLGATLVPLNVRLGAPEIEWQLRDCDARIIVADERTVELAGNAIAKIGIVVIAVDRGGARAIGCEHLHSLDPAPAQLLDEHSTESILAIVYTSGTTGQPKGAMLTVGNFWWSAIGSALNIGTTPADRWLACMPLFHVGGLSIVLRSAIYGITAIVHDGFDPRAVNAAIDDEGVTIVSVVAVMLQRMLDAREDRPYPYSLRCVLLGGGPAPRPLLEQCAADGIPAAQTYGLTETTSQLATLAPEDALRKIGAAGRPIYPNSVRIEVDGRVAKPGEPGEIVVKGPVVMAGYVGQPDATARAILDGWLHTGDAGTLDDDGYLYVLDRRDDLIITGGENVYPAEVESALLAHPSVVEAGVVGIPDPEWGQSVVAFVRTSASHDPADAEIGALLREYLRGRLASYKSPRIYFAVVEPLPRTASGKLRRTELRRMAAAESGFQALGRSSR